MQLETAHLSGSPRFNEAFAAQYRPPLLPAPLFASSDAQGTASGAGSTIKAAESLSPTRQA